MNLYTVHYTYPSNTGWSTCFGLQVVAADAEAAKLKLLASIPNARIWGIDTVGAIDSEDDLEYDFSYTTSNSDVL